MFRAEELAAQVVASNVSPFAIDCATILVTLTLPRSDVPQAKFVVTHSSLAKTAREAASLAGLKPQEVFTLDDRDDATAENSI